MEIIIVLILVGFALIVLEMFLPGMVAGILGVCCLIGGVGLTYVKYGLNAGTLTLLGVVVGAFFSLFFWMRHFHQIGLGKKIILNSEIGSVASPMSLDLIGKEGISVTPLRPSGVGLFDKKRFDVITEGNLIETGQKIKVIQIEGVRLVVRALKEEKG